MRACSWNLRRSVPFLGVCPPFFALFYNECVSGWTESNVRPIVLIWCTTHRNTEVIMGTKRTLWFVHLFRYFKKYISLSRLFRYVWGFPTNSRCTCTIQLCPNQANVHEACPFFPIWKWNNNAIFGNLRPTKYVYLRLIIITIISAVIVIMFSWNLDGSGRSYE